MLMLASACGGGEAAAPTSSPSTAASPATASPAGQSTVVPDVAVRDVGTGADVNIRTLGLSDRPTLYWFWAPH